MAPLSWFCLPVAMADKWKELENEECNDVSEFDKQKRDGDDKTPKKVKMKG